MEFTMIETGWLSLLPPIIAIALALMTKEVYRIGNNERAANFLNATRSAFELAYTI